VIRTVSTALRLVLAAGILGTSVELLLLGHDESATQVIPLVVLVSSVAALSWMSIRPSRRSVRSFQAMMLFLVVSGLVGIVLHFQANLEFQREVAPSLGWWALAGKAIRAKAPPALAPGAMVQLGLLGLIVAFGHVRATSEKGDSEGV
jgi:hypothetical protein